MSIAQNFDSINSELIQNHKVENYKNLDVSTFSELNAVDSINLQRIVTGFTYSLGLISEKYDDTTVLDFTYDIEGAKVIEGFLLSFVKPNIVRFDVNSHGYPELKRVKSLKGLPTSNPAKIKYIETFMTTTAGYVFGQCLVQHMGGKWIKDKNDNFAIQAGEWTLMPYWKPLKFTCFGAEDGLVGWMQILKPAPAIVRHNVAVSGLIKKFTAEHGPSGRVQMWHGPDGHIEQVKIWDKTNSVCKVLPITEEAKRGWELLMLEAAQPTGEVH